MTSGPPAGKCTVPDFVVWITRVVFTVAAAGLLVLAIVGTPSDPLLRIGFAAVAGVLLLAVTAAWLDVAILLLATLVVFAALHVNKDPAPDHRVPQARLYVRLARLRARDVAADHLRVRDDALLIVVVRQGDRTLVHQYRVVLARKLSADRGQQRLAVDVVRDDVTLQQLARDLDDPDALYLVRDR